MLSHQSPPISGRPPSSASQKDSNHYHLNNNPVLSGTEMPKNLGSTNNNSSGLQTQQFCLRWNNYQSNLTSVFDQLLQSESFVDVTLACDGHSIKAHKMVLSACSPYFQALFVDNPCQHPIIIMRDIKWPELKAAVEFMYKGEINVSQDQIGPLLKVAEMLKIRGLAEVNGDQELSTAEALAPEITSENTYNEETSIKKIRSEQDQIVMSPNPRKRRWPSTERSSLGSPVDSVSESIETSPLHSTTNTLSHSNLLNSTTPIPPPFPQSLEAMPLSINHTDDMEIKPGIAEMIREEERVSQFLFT